MNTYQKMIKLIPRISFVVSLLLLIAGMGLSYLPTHETYTYKNGVFVTHSWENWFYIAEKLVLYSVLTAAVIMTVTCIVSRLKWREKIVITLVRTWLIAIVCVFMVVFSDAAVFGLFGKDASAPQYYEFTDGTHTIVIEEESILLAGWGTIYQVKDDRTAVVIGTIHTDDGIRNEGNYQIEWFEDGADITYHTFFTHDSTDTETVKFEP